MQGTSENEAGGKSGCAMRVLTPVVVSASRATDVPKFYADWLLARLRAGFCTWTNPFNRQPYRVSFEKTRALVFWTKDPKPLLSRLDELEDLGFHQYYFQFTLNDYVREGLEPNVPSVEERIATFRALAERIGAARVIWRYDPLLLSPSITIDTLIERIAAIGRALKDCTEKLVFSFADIAGYRKVIRNLAGTGCREFTHDEKIEFVTRLCELNRELGMTLATCAEDIDLAAFGVHPNKCVDDDLMVRLFHEDTALMEFLGAERDLFGNWTVKKSKKDKGQRKACSCVISKDIGMYDTCPHLCRYCYANASADQVLANWKRHGLQPAAEAIIEV